MSECGDAEKPWYPQRHVCYATMELASADRVYRSLHEAMPYHDGTFTEWVKEPDGGHPFHFMDGVHLFVSEVDLNPDDTFLSRPARPDTEGG